MRGGLGLLAALALGAFACDGTPGIQNVPLGITLVEGLLEVSAGDPTLGAVILETTSGNCPTYQKGLGPDNISNNAAFFMTIQLQDGDGGFLPLTAGSYTIETGYIPSSGGYAFVTEYETTVICQVTPTGSNSGTITLDSLPRDAGATSVVTYDMVYGYDEFTGSFPLNTCVIPDPIPTPDPDAGYCYFPNNGGPI